LVYAIIYQEIDGVRREIDGGYIRKGAKRVGFQLAAYDTTRSLVIDPVLAYSTYLGGSGFDESHGIAVDAGGNAYVIGSTGSADFPTTSGAFQSTFAGGTTPSPFDAFVTKLNPTGTGLVYSTYLGGSVSDEASSIAVDANGSAYLTGSTNSADFPTTAGAFQPNFASGTSDAFVTKLDHTGSAIVYSTYLGGSAAADSFDSGTGIAVDAAGNAHVTGYTTSTNFPTTPGAFQPTASVPDRTFFTNPPDAFVTKLNPTGSALVYSTYLSGSGHDLPFGIAVDGDGNAYVAGSTTSTNFPTTPGAFQSTLAPDPLFGHPQDAFVTKFDPAGALVYSTYLGGSGDDKGTAITVDPAGNAYVTGGTGSTDFPTTAGAFQPAWGGGFDKTFVTKLNATGSTLVYSTYLGGGSGASSSGIAVDADGNAYIIGLTFLQCGRFSCFSDFPTTLGAFQPSYGGGNSDAFVTKLNPAGSGLVYSSYLGGSSNDYGSGIALDASGNTYVTGATISSDFPTTPGALQAVGGGFINGSSNSDAYVAKIVDVALPSLPPPLVVVPSLPPVF